MNPEFWRDKTVLVTGHTGFKGMWATLWLDKLGAKVVGVSLPGSDTGDIGHIYRLMNDGSQVTTINCDITDLQALKEVVKKAKPDVVLHMAAQALVRPSYANPVETFSTNVMGTVHILQAVLETDSVAALLCVTSDKCYENKEWLWGYRESDRLGGYDPYSNSKACSEMVVQSYRDSFYSNSERKPKTGLATARAGNVIGGGDRSPDRLLPDLLRGFQSNTPVEIRNPRAVRPWQHVLEPLSGYLEVIENLYNSPERYSGAWNFGPAESGMQSVERIANLSVEYSGGSASWKNTGNENEPHEASLLKLDCSKSNHELNWYATWSVEDAVKRTVNWDIAYQKDSDMRSYSVGEIEDFETSARGHKEG